MKKKGLIIWLLILVVLPASLYMLGYIPKQLTGDEVEAAATSDNQQSLYLALEPPFVVNFSHQGTLRYLQISIEVMYYDQRILDQITAHMPAVRNDLILLFSDQSYEKLSSLTGKETLREEIKAAINEQIQITTEANNLGEIYFTNFVMQ